MSATRPTGEQIRFRSSTTGDHVLDDYLESAEKGGRTLSDLLSDLFNEETGHLDGSLLSLRLNPSTNDLEFRSGEYIDPDAGWVHVANYFNWRGLFSSAITYSSFDLILDTNSDVYIVTSGEDQTFADIAAMRASSNTDKMFDVSTISVGGITYTLKTEDYTASNNDGVLADTTAGSFTVTLPAAPSVGTQVVIADPSGQWATNNLTIARNGSTISGVAADRTCSVSSLSLTLVFTGSTWSVSFGLGGASFPTTGATGDVVTYTGSGFALSPLPEVPIQNQLPLLSLGII